MRALKVNYIFLQNIKAMNYVRKNKTKIIENRAAKKIKQTNQINKLKNKKQYLALMATIKHHSEMEVFSNLR